MRAALTFDTVCNCQVENSGMGSQKSKNTDE